MAERCLLVLPTYNQVAHVRSLIEEILLIGDLLGEPTLNVLMIDDHSSDGTASVAEDLKREYRHRVYVLHRLERLGLASAYSIGFRYAVASNYDYVVQMAADRSHNPSTLPQLLKAAQHADLVLASRYAQVDGSAIERASRAILGALARSHSKLALGLPIADPCSSFTCIRGEALAKLDLNDLKNKGTAYQFELSYRCAQRGLRVTEVPFTLPYRLPARLPGRTVWEALHLLLQRRLGALGFGTLHRLQGVPVNHTRHDHRRRT